jgi:RimJ/RimL family protein N-acetyltransferase
VNEPSSRTGAPAHDTSARTTAEGLAYRVDAVGRPVGLPVDGWTPREPPRPQTLGGRYCRLEAWDAARHADVLTAALLAGTADEVEIRWTYLFNRPATTAEVVGWLDGLAATPGTWPMVLVVTDGGRDAVEGTATFMRTDVAHGAVEVGSIVYSSALQRSRAATEAMWLMARHAVLDLGYRRYEWKCDALNAPSRAAAARLGFSFEGVFRNAVVYKGRNRDTAWFAMTDDDVSALAPAYDAWLDPANFDADGVQRTSLSALTSAALGRA